MPVPFRGTIVSDAYIILTSPVSCLVLNLKIKLPGFYSHWSVFEHRTRKQDKELENYTAQNLENMADLHGES